MIFATVPVKPILNMSQEKFVFSDEDTYKTWVTETRKQLIRFCFQIINNWSEAEDLAQETYIRAWQKRSSYRGDASVLTWHIAIARRVCIYRLRKLKRMKTNELNVFNSTPDYCIDTKIDVDRALQKLGADEKIILYLRVGEDLPFEEIAKILNRTPNACRKRFQRAKEKFKLTYSGKD